SSVPPSDFPPPAEPTAEVVVGVVESARTRTGPPTDTFRPRLAVTPSLLTPTAIAAPIPAPAETDLLPAVVEIVAASVACTVSEPGTERVAAPARRLASV